METGNPDLDLLNISLMRLLREVNTEKEYCKNFENMYKTLESDVTRVQKNNAERKGKINEVNRKYSLLQSSVESTRKSITLVNELLCDLKKQLYLERMTTNEKSSKYKETITKYESIWDNYQAIYMTFPMAKEVRDLRVAVKLDGITLARRRVEMEDLKRKIKVLQEVTEKQNTCMTVEVAELMLKRRACAAKRETLQKTLRELKTEVTSLKKKKAQMLESLIVRGKAAAAPAGLSDSHAVQKSPGLTSVTLHTPPVVKKREAIITPEQTIQKTLLYSPLELPMIRLPVLKLPVFNSPPRKIPRSHPPEASAIIRNLNAMLNPVELPKEVDHIPPASDIPRGEEARDNTTLVDLTSSLQCDTENRNAPEQTSDFHSEPDIIPEEQQPDSNTTDNAPVSETLSQEKRLDLNSSQPSDGDAAVVGENDDEMDPNESPCPTQPSSGGNLEEEILNDEARKAYLYRLKQSPELNFTARTNYVEAWDPNDKNANGMPSDEACSPYFACKGNDAGNQSQKTSDMGSNYDEDSIRGCDADEGEGIPDSVSAILAQYGHSTLSSPTGSINIEDEINLQTNQISGGGDASGAFFSFGRTSNQNPIRSLFGGGDAGPSNEACQGSGSEGKEGQKKTTDTFSFSFEKKTTASNFFKLFN